MSGGGASPAGTPGATGPAPSDGPDPRSSAVTQEPVSSPSLPRLDVLVRDRKIVAVMLDGVAVRGVCQVDVRQSFDSVSMVTLEIAVSDIVQREVPRENKTFVELHLDTAAWDDAAARLE